MKHFIDLQDSRFIVIEFTNQPKVEPRHMDQLKLAEASPNPGELATVLNQEIPVVGTIHRMMLVDSYGHPQITFLHSDDMAKLLEAAATIRNTISTTTLEDALRNGYGTACVAAR